jgi:hypothetical protein
LRNQRQFLGVVWEEGDGRAVLSRRGTSHGVHMQDVESVVEGVEWVLRRREEILDGKEA